MGEVVASSESPSTSVLLVDDHVLVTQSLGSALAAEPAIEVVGTACSVAQAVDTAVACRPDVVLMDLRLPDGNGIDAAERILEQLPDTKVVILSAAGSTKEVADALAAGCAGFLEKTASLPRVVRAIRAAARGELVLSTDQIAEMVVNQRRPTAPRSRLSGRELEVLELLAMGLSNHQIAAELYISFHTARAHVRGVLSKLGASTRLEAVAVARANGLLDGGAYRRVSAL